MANKEIFDFAQPSSDLRLWRYMDFSKYSSMLLNQSLFFCRGDLFLDTFEGSYTAGSFTDREIWIDERTDWGEITKKLTELGIGNIDEFRKTQQIQSRNFFTRLNQVSRQAVFVNCWHANDFESAAMWELYGGSGSAIAVESKYSLLDDALDDSCMLGLVQYVDFAKFTIPFGNQSRPFMYKRRSFEHEREVRCLYWDNEYFSAAFSGTEQTKLGILKKVPLDELVTRVHVAPLAKPWFFELVSETTRRYGLNVEIKQSNLFSDPLF